MAQSTTIRKGGTVVVELLDGPKRLRPLPLPAPGLHATPAWALVTDPSQHQILDWGTRYTETVVDLGGGDTDTRTSFVEISHETGFAFADHDARQIFDALVNQLQRVRVAGSGREIWSAVQLEAGSAQTDGMFTGLLFRERRATDARRFELISESPTWSARVSAANRIADINDQIARDDAKGVLDGRPELLARRTEIAKEPDEPWEGPSLARVGREGTLRPRLTDGIYDTGVDSLYHYQSWRAWDTANYKITAGPNFYETAAALPPALVGPTECTSQQIFCASQLMQFTLQWAAVYLIGTIFFYSEVAIPTTVAYNNRLPVFPYAFSLEDSTANPYLSNNDQAVSYSASLTRAYGIAIEQDHAIEQFSPYFFIILVGRIGGRWLITIRDLPAKRICAQVRTRQNRGAEVVRYVWGITAVARANDPLDFGNLSTADVLPRSILDADIFDHGSIFPGS